MQRLAGLGQETFGHPAGGVTASVGKQSPLGADEDCADTHVRSSACGLLTMTESCSAGGIGNGCSIANGPVW